jgi:hypothetical protein
LDPAPVWTTRAPHKLRAQKGKDRAGERLAVLRDELNEPLRIGSSLPGRSASAGGWTFLAVAALVALTVGLGEEYLLLSARPQNGGRVAAALLAHTTVPEVSPPLRLVEAPAKPPRAADPADKTAAPSITGTVRVRSGAPEPLTIDVQQALARLRAQDPSPAGR